MTLSSNARQIQSLMIWSSGAAVLANVLTLDNYTGYDFKGNPGAVSWTLNAAQDVTLEDGTVVTNLQPITSGRVDLTTTVADAWGADDQVLFDFTALALNLNLI